MGKKIAVVTATPRGGVRTVVFKVFAGLREENYNVELLVLPDPNLPYVMYNDLKNIDRLENSDCVLYLGSIAWLSHVFINGPKKGLFIHGFMNAELSNVIKYEPLRAKAGAVSILMYRKIFNSMMCMLDFFICHSLTSAEQNKVQGNCAILPQFVVEEDIRFFEKFSKLQLQKMIDRTEGVIRIIAYTSLARSPRMLSSRDLLKLARKLGKSAKRRFEFYIVDPTHSIRANYSTGLGLVKTLEYLPKPRFLDLLASSNLYIERGVEEEIGFGSLEAGLLSIPVCKMTLPQFMSRQDYGPEDMVLADSVDRLAEVIVEYVNNVECYEPSYGKSIRDFTLRKRIWREVKKPLVRKL
jgi:hypothetical protein